jgi:Domain of unknown function (DUF4136)/PDZ domain
MKKSIVFIYIALFCSGCGPSEQITNLSPVYLDFNPTVTTYEDPNATNINWYQTFSVFPYSFIEKESNTNPILQQQLLFYVRNLFEEHGFKFVQLNEEPDFLLTVDASSKYQETYVPPTSITLPVWVPGQTITSESSTNGNLNFNTFGDVNTNGWGNYNQETTTTTYVPGYATTETYTQPGYMVGRNYPIVRIQVFDGKTYKSVWYGSGVGTSRNPDVRISGQLVMRAMVKQFPTPNKPNLISSENGYLGISPTLFTIDGNSFYPTILDIKDGMPASNTDIHKYDMIVAINGQQTRNMPIPKVIQLLRGPIGSTVEITVWRLGEKKSFIIKRAPRIQ